MRLFRFRWLPRALTGRIVLLQAATLATLIGLGVGLFCHYQFEQTLAGARHAASMLTDATAQTVTESAVVGDYDTIQDILQQLIAQYPFSSASFMAADGATLQAIAPTGRRDSAPAWLITLLTTHLHEVDRVISVGGRDYGLLRLRFDAGPLAAELWRLAQPLMILALTALIGALLLLWLPLGRWLSARDQTLQAQRSTTPEQAPEMHRDEPARLSTTVERLISEREASRQALERALDAARAADETKAQFLANISHELRTPLHGVLGALEILRDTPLSPQQQPYLEAAHSSATALQTLIDEVLSFSQLKAGKLQVHSEIFELRRTVEDVAALFGQRASARHLELACFIAPTAPDRLQGDPRCLQQILTTLMDNALKFTEQGEVVLSVTAEPLATARVLLHFEVRDTGIGIPADKQSLLFQPFVQGDGSHSRRFGGTGLGLSISRQLTELMGGKMSVDSQPGVGSRFRFCLPFTVAMSTEPRNPIPG